MLVVVLYVVKEAAGYAEENGLLFMETSAKTAVNVNEIFVAIGTWLCVSCAVGSQPRQFQK